MLTTHKHGIMQGLLVGTKKPLTLSRAAGSVTFAEIERIAGSYSGIMGLPLFETGELLAAVGAHA